MGLEVGKGRQNRFSNRKSRFWRCIANSVNAVVFYSSRPTGICATLPGYMKYFFFVSQFNINCSFEQHCKEPIRSNANCPPQTKLCQRSSHPCRYNPHSNCRMECLNKQRTKESEKNETASKPCSRLKEIILHAGHSMGSMQAG